MIAMATAPAISREVLEDRWACATHAREIGDEWSELMETLDSTLIKLQEAVTRREFTGTIASDGGTEYDGSGEVHDLVHETVRTTMLDAIERLGVAR